MNGFIFDMDGCLLDSIGIWHEAEQRVLDTIGIELTKEQRDELNTLTLEEAGKWFFERFGALGSGDAVVHAIMDYMLDFYHNRSQAVPGALGFVRGVYEAGMPACVLSSSPQSFLQAGLSHTGLKQYFPDELIVSADDMGMTKRNLSTFERMCGLLGTKPENTWLFDDSWYATATAHEAGLHVVGVHSSDNCGTREELGRYCEQVIEDFTELNYADFLS